MGRQTNLVGQAAQRRTRFLSMTIRSISSAMSEALVCSGATSTFRS